MAFEIVKKFVVKAEPEAVWSFLTLSLIHI